jgi:hypothetical protein
MDTPGGVILKGARGKIWFAFGVFRTVCGIEEFRPFDFGAVRLRSVRTDLELRRCGT